MPQQDEDLVGVHLDVKAIDRLEAVIIFLLKVLNFKKVTLELFKDDLSGCWLVVLRFEVLGLELSTRDFNVLITRRDQTHSITA